VLVDSVRALRAEKRGGERHRITLPEQTLDGFETIDILALDEALDRMSRAFPRQARVVELMFFSGLGYAEIGLILETSERTAKRYWAFARAWLHRALGAEDAR
jgi:RNA polymerase sigma factor (TIGR02999 family)